VSRESVCVIRVVCDELPDLAFDPADPGEDLASGRGPGEDLGVGVPVLDVGAYAVDQRVDRVNVSRRIACLVMIPNPVSIWLIQLDPTGVKRKVMFGFAGQPGMDVGCVVSGQVFYRSSFT
jgi:hypothetical protein